MPWFKVDDQLHSHPKARRAGLSAMGLWTVAGSHCMSYLTDGFVEAWFVESWPKGRELASRLVEGGLWLVVEGGWQFHEWEKFQPTRDQVLSDREAAAERMRRVRANKAGNTNDRSGEQTPNNSRTNAVGSATPVPVPSPVPYPDSFTSSQSGLSPIPRGDGDWTDRIETIRQLLTHDAGIPEPSNDEIVAWGTYVLARAKTVVHDEVAYLDGAITRFPDEVDTWFVKHRRNQLREVNS